MDLAKLLNAGYSDKKTNCLYKIRNLANQFKGGPFFSELKSLYENVMDGRTSITAANERFRLFAKIYSRRMAK